MRLSVLFALALVWPAALAQENRVDGAVTAVRVYRGQALVTRRIAFRATAGAQEVVVGNLPAAVLPSSLYATADANLTVRAVRYRATAVTEEPRPEVAALDQKIEELQDKQAALQSQGEVLKRHLAYLDKLENFVAPTATVELTKGVLDPTALREVATFSMDKRGEIAAEQLQLAREQKALGKELAVAQRERAKLAGLGAASRREAVIFVEADEAAEASLELNYLVGQVTWSPAYIARLGKDTSRLELDYHGVVTQTSGEDWNNVALVLSTGFPTMQANAPVLAPLRVALAPLGTPQVASQPVDADEYARQRKELEERLRGARAGVKADAAPAGPMAGAGGAGADKPARPSESGAWLPGQAGGLDDVAQNVFAGQLQQLELAAPEEALRRSRPAPTEGLAIDYPLAGRVSLRSRDEQQMFRIAQLNLAATFYYTAVPLLSEYVYQAVEAANAGDVALLPGPYTAYLEGAFAGQGNLPLTAVGQPVTIGFGTESRLKVARELVDKQTDVRGGNQQLRYKYRFRLQNYLPRPAVVRLWDRLPLVGDKSVEVTLLTGEEGLSADALYREQERTKGLLRWDVEVPAGASGARAKTMEYQFQLEFDKNFTLGGLPAETEDLIRRDIEALKQRRGL